MFLKKYWCFFGGTEISAQKRLLCRELRVTTHLENLEKSGNFKVVREKSG